MPGKCNYRRAFQRRPSIVKSINRNLFVSSKDSEWGSRVTLDLRNQLDPQKVTFPLMYRFSIKICTGYRSSEVGGRKIIRNWRNVLAPIRPGVLLNFNANTNLPPLLLNGNSSRITKLCVPSKELKNCTKIRRSI